MGSSAALVANHLEPVDSGQRRCKVLLSAYACHPRQGSEPGVGWHWMRALAAYHDIWLVTEEARFAAPTAEAVRRDPQLRDAVTVVPVPRVRAGERWFGPLAYYRTYRLWQRAALRKARELHASVGFDLVHQLNMIGYREPGYLAELRLPMVWGPIGGFAQLPWRYLPVMGVGGALMLGARNAVNEWQMRTSLRVRRTMANAAGLIAATSIDQRAIARLYGRDAVLIHETGCTRDPVAHVRTIWDRQPLRVLWCGRMIPSKAVSIALRAVAMAGQLIPVKLHLYGTGPQEMTARALAKELGIQEHCRFHGQVSHAHAIEAMHRSHVLLFPSLQEATSATVPEALATGLPVLCHALCGHGDIVTDAVGGKVPAGDSKRSVVEFAAHLVRLWREPDRLRACSMAAIRRATQLQWDEKAAAANELYRAALATRTAAVSSPRFGPGGSQ